MLFHSWGHLAQYHLQLKLPGVPNGFLVSANVVQKRNCSNLAFGAQLELSLTNYGTFQLFYAVP